MKHYLLFICCCLFFLPKILQAQQLTFSSVIYGNSNAPQSGAIATAADNGYVIVGRDEDNSNGLIIRTDSAGNILWSNEIAGATLLYLNSIITTTDSSYVIAGVAYSTGNKQSAVCIKISATGNLLWSSTFGNSIEWTQDVQQTYDSGYVITGNNSTGHAFIAKLNPSGVVQWNYILSASKNSVLAASVVQLPDSGYVITGSADTSANNNNNNGAFIARLNKTGAVVWSKRYVSDTFYISGCDVAITRNGFLCYLNSFGLMQTDTGGNILWLKELPYIGSIHKLHQVRGSDYAFMAGDFGIETDSSGNVIYSNEFNVDSRQSDLTVAKDKGFVIVGNGPLLGVRVEDIPLVPQIGLIKTDSLWQGKNCNFSFPINSFSSTNVKSPPFKLTTSVDTAKLSLTFTIDTVGLIAEYGCVAFGGGVKNYTGNNMVSVFPNPAADGVNVDLTVPSSITIFNLMGQQMFYESAKATGQNLLPVNVSAYPNGLYFLKAQSDNNLQTLKFVVQH